MTDHQLSECPTSPNCVSTQAKQKSKKMDPIPFELDPKNVVGVIRNVVESRPRTNLEKETDNYLHYTFKSCLFGFIDDVEFLVDGSQKLIHFRSASRTGYSDFGVNENRMSELSKAIKHQLKKE